MDITYEPAAGYLRVVASGPFDLQQARAGLGDVLRECQARGITRILVDGRDISTLVSVADRYDLATQLAAYGQGRIRMALVVSTANMFTKTLEDTARNLGVFLVTTDSMDEGLAFLGLKLG